jgi:hypothetical protein
MATERAPVGVVVRFWRDFFRIYLQVPENPS